MKDLITIIIPNYNGGKYLEEMLESIIKQTYKKWELIIVDDGSTDNSMEIIDNCCKKDKRIKLIKRPINMKGAQICRNIGLKAAVGEYVIFFDADDLIPPYALEQRVRFMVENPEIDFAVFPTVSFISSFSYKKWEYCNGYKREDSVLEDLISYISLPFGVWSNIYRTSSLKEKNVLWDINVQNMQDSDFNISVLLAGLKYKLQNSYPSYYYRSTWNPDSVGQSVKSDSKFQSRLYVLSKRVNQFWSISKYKGNVLILAYYFYLIEIKNGNTNNLMILLKNKPYSLFWGLSKRLLWASMISKKVYIKGKLFNIISFLFAPIFTLRFKLYQKRKTKKAFLLFKEYRLIFADHE